VISFTCMSCLVSSENLPFLFPSRLWLGSPFWKLLILEVRMTMSGCPPKLTTVESDG